MIAQCELCVDSTPGRLEMLAFDDHMPGAWKLAHATKMTLGLLHLSSPRGGRHGSSSENGDQIALLTGQTLPEILPWLRRGSFQVDFSHAFSV